VLLNLDLPRLALGLLLSALIGGLGYARGSLSAGGWAGAILVGTAAVGFVGWTIGALVVLFFVSSSALSHWRKAAKAQVAADKFDKTERRDFGQSMANGGAVLGLSIMYAIAPVPALWAAIVGALAAVTADTWATEIGTLSPTPPRLVTNGRSVEPGVSGAITVYGTLGSAAGALAIGLGAALLRPLLEREMAWWAIPLALGAGLAGSLADSLLGATVQHQRWCQNCRTETERRVHRCGTATTYLRGWRLLDNDGVNFVASLVGALTGALLWWLGSWF
jgi:uncharacterized protein (TIGR00297 family)